MAAEYTLVVDAEAIDRLNTMAAAARSFEAPAWAEAGIRPGAAVLDVGCGTGVFAAEFGELVGPAGRVVAIDSSKAAVEACAAYLAHRGLRHASVIHGDALTAKLDPRSFDAAHLRLLLIHLGSRAPELLGVVRELLRPGGHVVLTDLDGSSCGASEMIPEVEEVMEAWLELMRRRGNDVRMGIHLPALAAAAGFEIVSFRGAVTVIPPSVKFRLPHWETRDAMISDGVASEADWRRWEPALEAFTTTRTCYYSAPIYTLVARRPG